VAKFKNDHGDMPGNEGGWGSGGGETFGVERSG